MVFPSTKHYIFYIFDIGNLKTLYREHAPSPLPLAPQPSTKQDPPLPTPAPQPSNEQDPPPSTSAPKPSNLFPKTLKMRIYSTSTSYVYSKSEEEESEETELQEDQQRLATPKATWFVDVISMQLFNITHIL